MPFSGNIRRGNPFIYDHMESSNHHPPLIGGPEDMVALVLGTLLLIGMVTAFVFYVLTQQKALSRCAPENRAMQPSLVWLLMIPCFSMIWHFFVVVNVSKSLEAEFQKRGIRGETQPGKVIGLVMCSLNCVSDVCGAIGIIPLLGLPFLVGKVLFGFAWFVCWIIYWILIAVISKKLISQSAPLG